MERQRNVLDYRTPDQGPMMTAYDIAAGTVAAMAAVLFMLLLIGFAVAALRQGPFDAGELIAFIVSLLLLFVGSVVATLTSRDYLIGRNARTRHGCRHRLQP